MFESLLHYLRTPYLRKDRRPWQTAAVVWGIVMFVLSVFRPFGLAALGGWRLVWVLLFSGLGSFLGLLFVLVLLPRLFPRFYDPARWTLGKNLLNQVLILLMIGVCTAFMVLAYWALAQGAWPAGWLPFALRLMAGVFILSPIPLVVTFFMARAQNLQIMLLEAQALNARLAASAVVPAQPEGGMQNPDSLLSLTGSTRENLMLSPRDLLFIEASGNYVRVRYLENEIPRQKLLRSTLSQMEEALSDFPDIIRCHRAYLVNLSRIANVEGNAAGYRLSFRQTPQTVPVSRAYTRRVKERVEEGEGNDLILPEK